VDYPDNWAYMIAAYTIVPVVLVSYLVSLLVRLRKVKNPLR